MKVIGAATLPLGTGAPRPWLCGSALVADQGLELRQSEEATGMGAFVIAGSCLLSHSLGLQGQRGCCAVCWNFLGNLSPHL